MKIKEVKISNVLSFGFKDSFDTAPSDIVFGDNLNIIVGANGSGKSNFTEILFTLFQNYFVEPYNYDYGYDTDRPRHPNYLSKRANAGDNLRLNKHSDSEGKESKLYIKITLGDSDKKNLEFIKGNIADLISVVEEYSKGLLTFDTTLFNAVNISTIGDVGFKFNVTNSDKTSRVQFALEEEVGNDVQKIVNFYLRNFDLIKKLIEVGISKRKYPWDNLNVSFEFLGSHRLFSSFPTSLDFSQTAETSIGDIIFQKKNVNIKNNSDMSFIFGLANAKAGNRIRKDLRNSRMTITESINKQFQDADSPFFKVNILLNQYLGLSIRHAGIPSENSDTLGLEIYKVANDKSVDFEQLSSGQKSIFTLIYLVITSELEDSFLMIDEPEIHLHPRLQRKYFELLKDFSDAYNLQSILITHSPIFIDEKSIKTTYRFFIENGNTKIIKPDNITASDEELIKFLSYTYSSKIFFTNKVILVEGDTDSFFFTYLLNDKIKSGEEVEFLVIGGKNSAKKWFDFLDKFKIKRYLIADFDYLDKPVFADLQIDEIRENLASTGLTPEIISEVKLVAPVTRDSALEAFRKTIDELLTKDPVELSTDELTILKRGAFIERKKIKFSKVAEEMEKEAVLKAKVEETILDLRNQDIYVLRWGDLENYLNIHNKGLQSVVDYCTSNDYDTMDKKFKDDLLDISGSIISK